MITPTPIMIKCVLFFTIYHVKMMITAFKVSDEEEFFTF